MALRHMEREKVILDNEKVYTYLKKKVILLKKILQLFKQINTRSRSSTEIFEILIWKLKKSSLKIFIVKLLLKKANNQLIFCEKICFSWKASDICVWFKTNKKLYDKGRLNQLFRKYEWRIDFDSLFYKSPWIFLIAFSIN